MPDFYKGTIPILDSAVAAHRDVLFPTDASFGAVPRDFNIDPPTMFASPSEMDVIPRSEWDARYDEQEATQSSLEHMYMSGPNGEPAFVNLDQNGDGHCWGYSTGHAMMLDRLKQGLPLVRLNPHAIAAILNRLNGGWCGASAKFVREFGCPVQGNGPGEWPLHSNDTRYDTPACRAAMAKHRVTEDWLDLSKQIWEQSMKSAQLATCGFMNIPAPSDFSWWGHSVCQVRWVRIEAGSWGPLILNSWLGWGRHGLAVLRGSQAIADGAVAVRSSTASVN